MPIIGSSSSVTQQGIQATHVAAGNLSVVSIAGAQINPGLQKLIAACTAEMNDGAVKQAFIRELSHFGRPPTDRNLETKLKGAGKNDQYYEFAIEAKESFAKFFEVVARHPSGQQVLVAAFSHAHSIYKEKIFPSLDEITFQYQANLFEAEIVLYLSNNLTGMPGFYGRLEALGLLFFLADNCFIEYANV